jgi:hypothetical protein
MPRWSRLLPVVALLTSILSACSSVPGARSPGATDLGWPPQQTNFELVPAPVNAELVVGKNRLLLNIIDRQNQSIASPDTAVALRFFEFGESRTTPAVETQATYMATIPQRPGLYRSEVAFDKAGEWGVEATATAANGSTRSGRFAFSVRETGTTPAIGAPAVASDNPTASTPDEIAHISTDDDPDPDFYEESVAHALAAHESFAVVFATPAFCTSLTCGPTLDLVKTAAADFKDRMTFIHVEPYELEFADGSLRPVLSDQNLPVSVPATVEWGLPTEPYVFVVDGSGKVTAKFEGIASAEELQAVFTQVADA